MLLDRLLNDALNGLHLLINRLLQSLFRCPDVPFDPVETCSFAEVRGASNSRQRLLVYVCWGS